MSLDALTIARKRIIQRLDISNGRGIIVADGRQFTVQFDDILDLVQAVEMIMLKLTGKVLDHKRRPRVHDRKALKHTLIEGGDFSLGSDQAPVRAMQLCDVTGVMMSTHYLRIETAAAVWDNWVCRLDELVKALYAIVADTQAAPQKIAPTTRPPRRRFRAPGSVFVQ